MVAAEGRAGKSFPKWCHSEPVVQGEESVNDDLDIKKQGLKGNWSVHRVRFQTKASIDEKRLAQLYSEFPNEDRELAEEGIEDYNKELLAEDKK